MAEENDTLTMALLKIGMMRKIAWFATGSEQYGVGRAILSLAGEMQRRGHECTLLTCAEGALTTQARDAGIRVNCLQIPIPPSFSSSPRSILKSLYAMRGYMSRYMTKLRAAVSATNADVLHVQWPNHVAFCACAIHGTSMRCIWEMPNSLGNRHLLAINQLLYQAVCWRYHVTVLANSGYTARSLGSLLVKPRVFHLGTDPVRFSPQAQGCEQAGREKLGLPSDAIVLGMISRLDESKGHILAIEALNRQIQRGVNVFLVIVGGPATSSYAADLRRLVASNGLESRVRFIGETTTAEALYGVFDLFLQVRIDPEPFGLSVIEAMMTGIPVVAHALGGPAETILDGVTGWHFYEPSADALDNTLTRAIAARASWKAFRQQARAHALTHYSVGSQARRYEAVLEEILE